jgi:endonuclease/exonuclease/phosphatase family metal-dependent hydrolase
MKKRVFRLTIIIFLIFTKVCFTQNSLRIVTYNILNYDGLDANRNNNFKTVLNSLNADIIVVQEIVSQSAVDSFAISALNNNLATIAFHDGYTTDNHIFYNPFEVQFLTANYISTSLRDIAEYKLRIPLTDDTVFVYSAHLKAGNPDYGDDDQQRLAEATVLRNHLNNLPQNTSFILCGDLNLYRSSEPAYQKLISEEQGNYGQLFDPIDRPGDWHNNSSFDDIHSQSTRTAALPDGGSTGGMDDRFDFILVSESMLDNVIINSYQAYGNDGDHFNQSIINGGNSAVSAEVANALYYASDHLPVITDIVFGITSIEDQNNNGVISSLNLYQNYPNPFNSQTKIEFSIPAVSHTRLTIHNITGQNISTLIDKVLPSGKHNTTWDASGYASGVYFFQIQYFNFVQTKKMLLVR